MLLLQSQRSHLCEILTSRCNAKHTGGVEVVINTNSKPKIWFMNSSSDWRTSPISQLKASRCFTGCKYTTCLQKSLSGPLLSPEPPCSPQGTPPGLSFRACTTLTVTLPGKNPNFLLKHFKTWTFLPQRETIETSSQNSCLGACQGKVAVTNHKQGRKGNFHRTSTLEEFSLTLSP